MPEWLKQSMQYLGYADPAEDDFYDNLVDKESASMDMRQKQFSNLFDRRESGARNSQNC